MRIISLCKGGTVMVGNCRNCRAIAATPTLHIKDEFLPPGWWPVVRNGNGGNGNGGSVPDPTRYAFLQGLGPVVRIVTMYAFGTRQRVYRAYIYCRKSDGRYIALVETNMTNNAMYAFWADMPNWMDVAQKMKLDILTGPHPEFIGKIEHKGRWQGRAQRVIA